MLAGDEVAVHGRARDDPDAGPLRLAGEVRDDAAELRPSGQPLRQQDLSADAPAGLVQRHAVAALGRHGRCLETARAAADHHDVASDGRPMPLPELELAAALGVLDARDRVAGMEVPDARLVAADAGADLVGPSARRPSSAATGP